MLKATVDISLIKDLLEKTREFPELLAYDPSMQQFYIEKADRVVHQLAETWADDISKLKSDGLSTDEIFETLIRFINRFMFESIYWHNLTRMLHFQYEKATGQDRPPPKKHKFQIIAQAPGSR